MTDIKDGYDVVVVGAGIGGLTCGALLAKNKRSVLVAEQGDRPGGYCASFEHRGYTFDMGLSHLAGCDLGGAIYETLDELGLRDHIEFIRMKPAIRIVGADYDLRVRSVEGLEDRLIELFPMETLPIREFIAECKAVSAEAEDMSRKPTELMNMWQKVVYVVASLFARRRVAVYGRKSWQEVVEGFFKDPKLRAIAMSIFPYFEPGVMARLPMAMLGIAQDLYYPGGGAQGLANVLAEAVQTYGGDLALDTRVKGITVEEGKAISVSLGDGRQVDARCVVSNVDARQTFLRLIGEEHLSSRFADKLSKGRLSGSAFIVSLGVKLNLKAMGFDGATIVYNPSDDISELCGADPSKCTVWINLHSIIVPSQAWGSTSAVQLVARLPYDAVDDWNAAEEDVADRLIASAEQVIPGLSGQIICRHIMSPSTLEQSTSSSQGAVCGWYVAPKVKKRGQKTPITNLYQAGQWAFPGGGVAAVVTSGRNAAQLVLKGK